MSTITGVYEAVRDVSITGVKRVYGYEPDTVNTADLPAQYVRLPQSEAGRFSDWAAVCIDQSKTRNAQLVILLETAGQSTTPANFANALVFMDRVDTALSGLDVGLLRDHTIKAGKIQKNAVDYWAVIADVIVRG